MLAASTAATNGVRPSSLKSSRSAMLTPAVAAARTHASLMRLLLSPGASEAAAAIKSSKLPSSTSIWTRGSQTTGPFSDTSRASAVGVDPMAPSRANASTRNWNSSEPAPDEYLLEKRLTPLNRRSASSPHASATTWSPVHAGPTRARQAAGCLPHAWKPQPRARRPPLRSGST